MNSLTSGGRFYAWQQSRLPHKPLAINSRVETLCRALGLGLGAVAAAAAARVAMHQRAVSMFVLKIKSMCPVLCAPNLQLSLFLSLLVLPLVC